MLPPHQYLGPQPSACAYASLEYRFERPTDCVMPPLERQPVRNAEIGTGWRKGGPVLHKILRRHHRAVRHPLRPVRVVHAAARAQIQKTTCDIGRTPLAFVVLPIGATVAAAVTGCLKCLTVAIQPPEPPQSLIAGRLTQPRLQTVSVRRARSRSRSPACQWRAEP